MIRQYESTFILDTHLTQDELEASIKKYSQLIEKQGGKVGFIDRWGKRRLAYEIGKKQYGYYICLQFEADGSLIKPLEKEFNMDDQCLRYLTVLVPESFLVEKKIEREEEVKESENETETLNVSSDDYSEIGNDDDEKEHE